MELRMEMKLGKGTDLNLGMETGMGLRMRLGMGKGTRLGRKTRTGTELGLGLGSAGTHRSQDGAQQGEQHEGAEHGAHQRIARSAGSAGSRRVAHGCGGAVAAAPDMGTGGTRERGGPGNDGVGCAGGGGGYAALSHEDAPGRDTGGLPSPRPPSLR